MEFGLNDSDWRLYDVEDDRLTSMTDIDLVTIGVGAQLTLGARHFARKHMCEKLKKCPNFT